MKKSKQAGLCLGSGLALREEGLQLLLPACCLADC